MLVLARATRKSGGVAGRILLTDAIPSEVGKKPRLPGPSRYHAVVLGARLWRAVYEELLEVEVKVILGE